MSAVSTVFGILIILVLIPTLLFSVYTLGIKRRKEAIKEKLSSSSLRIKIIFGIIVLLVSFAPAIALTYTGAYLITKDKKADFEVGITRGKRIFS